MCTCDHERHSSQQRSALRGELPGLERNRLGMEHMHQVRLVLAEEAAQT